MPDTVFRSPVSQIAEVPTPEAQNPDVPSTIAEVSPALQEELRGVPYSATYFDVKEIWNSDKLTLKEDLKAIDQYYRNRIESGEFKDDIKSFETIIKMAEKVTNCSNSSSTMRIMKIAEWVKFMDRVKDIDKHWEMYNSS